MSFKSLFNLLPLNTAYAHCDIPCGIYDPKAAQTAAKTVLVMVQKINALPKDDTNSFVRMVMNKEKHAQICKNELFTLWADYFKPEHLEMFPELHDTFWKTAKLCSENKHHVDEETAKKLVESVDMIADMFAKSKASK